MTQTQPITIQPSAASVFRKRIFPRYKTKADGTVPVLNRVTYAQAGFGLGFLASIAVPIYKLFKGDESTSFWGRLFGTYLGPAFLAMLNVVGIASCGSAKDPLARDLFSTAAKYLTSKFRDGLKTNDAFMNIYNQDYRRDLAQHLTNIIQRVCNEINIVKSNNPELAKAPENLPDEVNRFCGELDSFVELTEDHKRNSVEDFKNFITKGRNLEYLNCYLRVHPQFVHKVLCGSFPDNSLTIGLENCLETIFTSHGVKSRFQYDKHSGLFKIHFFTKDTFTHGSVNEYYRPYVVLSMEPARLPKLLEGLVNSINEIDSLEGQIDNETLNKKMLSVMEALFSGFSTGETNLNSIFGLVGEFINSFFIAGTMTTGYRKEDANGRLIKNVPTDNSSTIGGVRSSQEVSTLTREAEAASETDCDILAECATPETQSNPESGDPPVDSGDSEPQSLKFKVVKDDASDPNSQSSASVVGTAVSSSDTASQSPKIVLENVLDELQFQIDPAKDGEKKSLMKYLLIKAWVLVNCQGESAKAIIEELDKRYGKLAEEAKKIHLQFVSKEKQVVFPKEFRSLDQLLEVYGDKLSSKDLRDIVFELFANAPVLCGEYGDYKAKSAKKEAPIS